MGDLRLTEAQRRFLRRLRDEDGFGPVRYMHIGERRTGYSLKAKGLVMLDGAISSSITEGNASYSGMTFVLTEAGRAALKAREDGA